MLTRVTAAEISAAISHLMTENRGRLIELDQVNGDGDLGLSMDSGFRELTAWLEQSDEDDLGQLFRGAAKKFNECAPSSLGTILSFGLMGMARSLRGKSEASFAEAAQALSDGVDNIMVKAESKPGEKTIIDSLVPGAAALLAAAPAGKSLAEASTAAAEAAAEGSEATKQMTAVHGRAAYSAARSIGVLDGGSVVGRLIFEGLAQYAQK